jgi:hypothetical protein
MRHNTDSPPHFRQAPVVASALPKSKADWDTFYNNYLLNSLTDDKCEAGQNAVVRTLSQPAPNEVILIISHNLCSSLYH